MMLQDWQDVIDVVGKHVPLEIRGGWAWACGEIGEKSRKRSASVVGLGSERPNGLSS
jgi:hypothetical protein